MPRISPSLVAFFFGIFASAAIATAQDASDGETTAEKVKDSKNGSNFLVLPIIITEPAIGEGLGAAVVYFHRQPESDQPRVTTANKLAETGRDRKPPPTATGVFAAYTSNDTKAIGLGHSRTFGDDTWRFTAAVADADVNSTYYLGDLPFKFNIQGALLYGKLQRRIAGSDWFAGLSASVLDADADFRNDPDELANRGLLDFGFTDAGIAASLVYDQRDDTMMPSEGQLYDLTVWGYDEAIGGDFDYWTARFKANYFRTFAKKFVLGLRFEVATADGDVPFYAAPYVPLRGIPALRYQGELAGVVETELRYQFAKRWAVLGFVGSGFVDTGRDIVDSDDDIYGWGIGFRWLAAQEQNVWIGLDIARGPEEDNFYIQMVHPW